MENTYLTVFRVSLFETLYITGSLILVGLVLGLLENKANFYIQRTFGRKGIMVTAQIGTPIHEPKLAIIDEPLINLDPVMQKKVKNFLVNYVKNGGTIFISTHILEIAKQICTSIGIIYKGKLVYTGRIDDPVLQGRNFEEFFLELVCQPMDFETFSSTDAQYA